jgi:DNA-binding LytR/AlgR family response regulator
VTPTERRPTQQPTEAPPRLRIVGHDGALEVSAEALRFARAEENYVEIVWYENLMRRRRLLRCTLADIARQLGEHALRCHRSFLVSVAAVARIRGNAQGYRLTLFDIADEVPVSRARAADFFAELRQRRPPLAAPSQEKTLR